MKKEGRRWKKRVVEEWTGVGWKRKVGEKQ